MTWQDIEHALPTLHTADNGFTTAGRGIVTLADHTQVFVKIGADDNTRTWARKEIEVYEFLHAHSFPYVPKLLAYNTDRTAFALEALTDRAGWDWTDTWDNERIDKTLEAMDSFATLTSSVTHREIFAGGMISATADGWGPLATSIEKQTTLIKKLRIAGYETLADTLDIPAMAAESARFVFHNDSLVHNDVRADNCAWNASLQTVRLIDWNWAQISDRRIDTNTVFVHAHRAGSDVVGRYTNRLDASALQWLAGFWLHGAAETDVHNTSEMATLNKYRLPSGVTALELRSRLSDRR